MDIWRSLDGMVAIKLTSADLGGTITALTASGIMLHNLKRADDDLQVSFEIIRKDYKRLRRIATHRGDTVQIMGRNGIYWLVKGLLKRPVFLAGMTVFLFLVTFLPTRVLFIRVEGNVDIPTNLILEKCAQHGIVFGASRRDVRSEKLKNAILEEIPQLQWAGINTSGCTAIVSVRERSIPEVEEKSGRVGSIIAIRDGVISELTVIRGSAACKLGQAVRKGQVLISGYTDCGITIRAEQAEGEVFAKTQRNLTSKMPIGYAGRGSKTGETKKYSLIIGKKRINLYKGSGISDTSCDKMYLENYIVLPGDFQLPIAIVTETVTTYEAKDSFLPQEQGEKELSNYVTEYLLTQMVAGQILQKYESVAADDGCIYLTGNYACTELIGTMQCEENIRPYG